MKPGHATCEVRELVGSEGAVTWPRQVDRRTGGVPPGHSGSGHVRSVPREVGKVVIVVLYDYRAGPPSNPGSLHEVFESPRVSRI